MATNSQISRHDAIIDDLVGDAHLTSQEVLKNIENDVAAAIVGNEDPRPLIPQLINERWRNWSAAVASSLDRAAGDTIKMHMEMGLDEQGVTASDVGVVNEIKKTVTDNLNDLGSQTSTAIVNALTVGAITGLSVNTLAQQARIRISGYLATVEDQNVTLLQETYRTLIRRRNYEDAKKLLPDIRRAWGATPVGENLLSQSLVASHDSIMDFDSVYGQWRGESLGVTLWRYAGGVSATTRSFCAEHAGKEYTREQAREIWQNRTWGGKRSGDPMVVRGGYNCRHYWVPVNKNIVGNLRRLQQ